MATAAVAAPVPVGSPPPLVDGYQVDWVHVDASPHSIADAINALNGSGGFNILDSLTEYRTTIDLDDLTVPFAGADRLAVRVTGFVRLDAGIYQFAGRHDDGLRLTIGGEDVITVDHDTSVVTSISPLYVLAAGIYAFEAISWEQGGAFELELGTAVAGSDAVNLLAGFHAGTAVPEPGSLALAGLALAALAAARRRRG